MKPRKHVLQDSLYSSLLLPWREPHQRFRHGVSMLLATIRTFVGVVKLLQRVEYLMKELIIMTLFRGPPLYYVYSGSCHSGGEWGVNACLDGFEHLYKKNHVRKKGLKVPVWQTSGEGWGEGGAEVIKAQKDEMTDASCLTSWSKTQNTHNNFI